MSAMSDPERLAGLVEDYLNGLLDEGGMKELEDRLRAEPDARRHFVRYARLHTDLHLEVHAREAAGRALDHIDRLAESGPPRGRRLTAAGAALLAASVLLAAGAAWWLLAYRPGGDGRNEPTIAWLVNAQDCTWADGAGPAGDVKAGTVLKLERGLAEVHFRCGAGVLIEGPATVELLSGSSVRLLFGKLTARATGAAAGFAVLSPEGKLIDLGTEFGVRVSEGGATDVYVFEGKVEALPAGGGGVGLTRDQAARIAGGKVRLGPAGAGADQFVRAIAPPPVVRPRTLRLTFDRADAGGVRDAEGRGTGLTHRLPGTGGRLPRHDPNLRLDTARSRLELTTTNSDLNTQFRLHHGEYLGVRLSDLGFTGREDFAVTATIPDIPALEFVGQFGLYAGARSDRNIRGGLISSRRQQPGQYTQFLVNNHGGRDADLHQVGLLSTGTDLRLTLKRTGGKYALTVENLTAGGASTVAVRHPAFLDGERDLFVGLFGANTQSAVRKTLVVRELSVTVWAISPAVRAGATARPGRASATAPP